MWSTRIAIYFAIHSPFNTVLFYISSYGHCTAGAHFCKLSIFGESEGVAHAYSVSGPPFLNFADPGATRLRGGLPMAIV